MSYDGRYDYPPLEIGGGRIENLTISALKNDSINIITDNAASYAIHADYDSGDDLSIKNCNIKSDFYPAIGAGLFQNKTITIDNCYLEGNQENTGEHISSGGLGSLFVHNRPQSGVTGQKFIVKNCQIRSKLKNTISIYDVGASSYISEMEIEFINNIVYSDVAGYNGNIWWRNTPVNINKSPLSYGNTNDELNYDKLDNLKDMDS